MNKTHSISKKEREAKKIDYSVCSTLQLVWTVVVVLQENSIQNSVSDRCSRAYIILTFLFTEEVCFDSSVEFMLCAIMDGTERRTKLRLTG